MFVIFFFIFYQGLPIVYSLYIFLWCSLFFSMIEENCIPTLGRMVVNQLPKPSGIEKQTKKQHAKQSKVNYDTQLGSQARQA